jgi:hypothetical protein
LRRSFNVWITRVLCRAGGIFETSSRGPTQSHDSRWPRMTRLIPHSRQRSFVPEGVVPILCRILVRRKYALRPGSGGL